MFPSRRSFRLDHIATFEKKFNGSKKNIVVKNAVNHNSVNSVALDRKKTKKIQYIFSDKIFSTLDVTNQKSSGRCWIFAYLNYLRLLMVKKYNVDKFEFSATYLFFWDKLEKSHYFLQDIIKTSLDNALGLEEAKTMQLKLTYGWNSTRGGTWNAPNDHAPPRWFLEQSPVDRPSNPHSEDDQNYLL